MCIRDSSDIVQSKSGLELAICQHGYFAAGTGKPHDALTGDDVDYDYPALDVDGLQDAADYVSWGPVAAHATLKMKYSPGSGLMSHWSAWALADSFNIGG